ncbi:MAG: Mur ligase domain-containing protein, partial [Clostridia bacterium]
MIFGSDYMNLDLCKNIFFIGIGGISMSSLSMILKSRGYSVSGYDRSKNDETALLESNGIKISYN